MAARCRCRRHLAAANDRDLADLHTEFREFRQATISSFTAVRADGGLLNLALPQLLELGVSSTW
jgi:hypothetical protein